MGTTCVPSRQSGTSHLTFEYWRMNMRGLDLSTVPPCTAADLTCINYGANRCFRQQVCKVEESGSYFHGFTCNCGVRGSCNARKEEHEVSTNPTWYQHRVTVPCIRSALEMYTLSQFREGRSECPSRVYSPDPEAARRAGRQKP